MTKRTDIHRPGAIIPAHYEHVLSYNGATSDNGWPIPSFGINCELDRRVMKYDADGKLLECINGKHREDGMCCIIGLGHIAKVSFVGTGGTCQCSICSTHFVYGDVWKHVPTNQYLHVGHNCADKYQMLADRSEHELALGRLRAAAAVECLKAQKAEQRAAFLARFPGLEAALKCNHRIVQDIASRFTQWCSISEKQVALVMKLDAEAKAPPKPEEKHVAAPTGRIEVEGLVVSYKSYDSDFGTTFKMAVKVTTDAGNWLCWGTVPSSLLPTSNGMKPLVGERVRFTATLIAGREAHFALFKRPTCAVRVVSELVA